MREGVFRNRSLTTSGSLRKEKSLSMPYSVNGIRHFITHFGIIGSFCLIPSRLPLFYVLAKFCGIIPYKRPTRCIVSA